MSAQKIYEFDRFRLDPSEHILLRNGQVVSLTPKVFETLLVLVENNGHVVDKDALLQKVWSEAFVEETNLTKNISVLRKILSDNDSGGGFIETLPKRGYRFVAPVREIEIESSENGAKSNNFSSGNKKISVAAISVLLVLAIGLGYWFYSKNPNNSTNEKPIESIAVLPLENLSGDAAQEYFADGMTDLLITELIKIGNLRVISRNSAMQYKEKRKPISEIARELNVDAVVQGTALRSGDKVWISVQLFRAETEQSLWAENYERDLRDILVLQKEVTRGIVNNIKVKFTAPEQADLARQNFINAEAQDAYQKGLFYWHQGLYSKGSLEEIKTLHLKSFDYFEQAISLEPNNAQPYAGLAESCNVLASYGFTEYYRKSKEAALTAIRLDETNSQAHAALGFVFWRDEWKFEEAEREMKRAIELNPNDNRRGYALLLSSLGRHEEALEAANTGERFDPLNIDYRQYNGWIYIDARRYEAAEKRFRELIDSDPNDNFSRLGLSKTLAYQGRHQEAIAERLKSIGKANPAADYRVAWVYAMAGQRNEAMKILNKVTKLPKAETNGSWCVGIAGIYALLGDKEQSFVWLEKAYAKRHQAILYLKIEPDFDSLRDDPRFQDLLRRIGFPQ